MLCTDDVYVVHMSVIEVEAWKCDVCGYYWMKIAGRPKPTHCRDRKCRKRNWDSAITKPSEVAARVQAVVDRVKPTEIAHHPSCKCLACQKK
jgi:hypothetical protein